MSREIVAGRVALMNSFKRYYTRSINEHADSRLFEKFRKQKEQQELNPWIYLFHGKEGLGKTTAIHFCCSVAHTIADDAKKVLKIVTVDLDERSFYRGSIPCTKLTFMDTIVESFKETDSEFASLFNQYKRLVNKYRENRIKIQKHLNTAQFNTLMGNTQSEEPDTSGSAEIINSLPKDEAELYTNGEQECTDLLIQGIREAASDVAIIIVIDGYRKLLPGLEKWFRSSVLTKLEGHNKGVIFLIGGTAATLRNYRNDFSENTLFCYNLADWTLTRNAIKKLSSKKKITASDNDVINIERVTAGIPLIVHDILFHLELGTDISDLLDMVENDVSDVEILCSSIVSRFNKYNVDTAIKERIFSYAMLTRYNVNALAQLWDIPGEEASTAIEEMESKTSFIQYKTIHPYIRFMLRSLLIHEAGNKSQSTLKPFFKSFSRNNTAFFNSLLIQLQEEMPVAEQRCADSRYYIGIAQLINGMMWTSPADALKIFPGYYLELLYYNKTELRNILIGIVEFRSILPQKERKRFKQMISGLSLVGANSVPNSRQVQSYEDELLSYFKSVNELMNEFQRALYYHLKAQICIRKGMMRDAMESCNSSFSLLGNTSTEKQLLYSDYVLLGHFFFKNGEHENAIETFSNAVLIEPNGFITWYNMGLSRMALEEYEGAINALNEAVKIEPDHSNAWYNLGLSLFMLDLHSDAVSALTKASERSSEQPEIWFALGNSYSALNQHNDAVNAFKKVVQYEDTNIEAWILLGYSCSAAEKIEDAIEAYQHAVTLNPKAVEPLKELGRQYYKMERYEDAIGAFLQASQLVENDEQVLCMIAKAYLGTHEYDKAVETGKNALSINNKNAELYQIVADAQYQLEMYPDAIKMYEKSVEIEENNATAWQKIGTIYYTQKEYGKAIEALTKAVEFDPSLSTVVWLTIGNAYTELKQYSDALQAFDKGTQADAENSICWMRKGEIHSILEHYNDAFTCFSEVVKSDPNQLKGWVNRGDAALKINEFVEAVHSFTQVVELDPENAAGWYHLGLAYKKMDDHMEAIKSFREAATKDPDNTEIWYELGNLLKKVNDFSNAADAFEKCVECNPENSDYAMELGECYLSLNNFESAHDAYKKVLQSKPDDQHVLFQLALTAHSMEKYEDAITYYCTVTEKNDNHADAWFNCALAYHATGQFDNAIEVYKKYIKKWQGNSAALFNLGLAYHAKDDLDSAIICYRDAINVKHDNPDIWYNLAIALHTKELFGDAIQSYRKVLQYKPDHIDAWFNLGMAYYIWQNYTDAIDSYTNVIQLQPEHFTAWGNVAIAHFANGSFREGFDAARKALELNASEPWLIGNMVVGSLFTGDVSAAGEYADRLLERDPDRIIASQVISLIEDGLKKNPKTKGADELIRKFQKR